jgi:hypothetical protein
VVVGDGAEFLVASAMEEVPVAGCEVTSAGAATTVHASLKYGHQS